MITRALLALTLLLPIAAQAATTFDARGQTEALIVAFKAVKRAEEGQKLSPADLKANEAAFKALDGFLDQAALVHGPLEPHVKAFKPKALEAFKARFWETLRLVAYPNSGAFFESAQYTLSDAKPDGARIQVAMHATLEAQDLETDVIFYWGAAGRLVDISFDGASLVVDYRNQFGRIIKKKGVEGLIAVLEEKHAQITGAAKK